ncbi:MAG TPA: hypothetical protein VN282_02005 [Pyrinomonadaceae bacterium]|nr:hypothetical protein [Pyrinomonadaceae bacterium]
MIRELYKESKGITALIVTIFFLAQRRAITSGVEDLTKSVISSVVEDNQHFVDYALNQRGQEQSSRRSPRAVSDLDQSSWRRPKTAADKRGKGEAPLKDSNGGSELKAPPLKDKKPASIKSGKNHEVKVSKETFEPGDFRTSLPIQPEGDSFGGRTPSHDSPFGSTDEFI